MYSLDKSNCKLPVVSLAKYDSIEGFVEFHIHLHQILFAGHIQALDLGHVGLGFGPNIICWWCWFALILSLRWSSRFGLITWLLWWWRWTRFVFWRLWWWPLRLRFGLVLWWWGFILWLRLVLWLGWWGWLVGRLLRGWRPVSGLGWWAVWFWWRWLVRWFGLWWWWFGPGFVGWSSWWWRSGLGLVLWRPLPGWSLWDNDRAGFDWNR